MTMLRKCRYLLSLLILCGIASEAGAMQPSATPPEGGSAPGIIRLARNNRKVKRHKPSRPQRPKRRQAPRNNRPR